MDKHKTVKLMLCLILQQFYQLCLQISLFAKAMIAQTREMKMSTTKLEKREINAWWRVNVKLRKILTTNGAINQMIQLRVRSKRKKVEEWVRDTEELTILITEKCKRAIFQGKILHSSKIKGIRSITNLKK